MTDYLQKGCKKTLPPPKRQECRTKIKLSVWEDQSISTLIF